MEDSGFGLDLKASLKCHKKRAREWTEGFMKPFCFINAGCKSPILQNMNVLEIGEQIELRICFKSRNIAEDQN